MVRSPSGAPPAHGSASEKINIENVFSTQISA